jgi:cell division protein FtsZ
LAKIRPTENSLKYSQYSAEAQGVRQNRDLHIAVIGVGRAGNNTITRMMETGVSSVRCVAINTDTNQLKNSKAHEKILIGQRLTKGRGVHGDIKLGKAAITESRKQIEDLLTGVDIAFITAGLGGGTGAGAAPVIAEIAKRKGALTVGIVTMPFRKERGRNKHASESLAEMRKQCDTIAVIDNDKLVQIAPQLPSREAFRAIDQVLASMIKGIVETISTPSLVNLDYGDFKTIVSQGGMAIVGVGESDAPNRAEEALRNALKAPLFDVDYAAATSALINVTGDNRLTLQEVNHIGEIVTQMMNANARVIWGATVNPEQEGKLKVTLVMAGLHPPQTLSSLGKIAPQLFDLEPCAEIEQPLAVNLNLYQMEKGPL